MTTLLRSMAAVPGVICLAAAAYTPASAASCDPGKAGDELGPDEAQAVYDCIKDDLHAGYVRGPKRWIPAEFVADYRSWTPASMAGGSCSPTSPSLAPRST